MMSSVQMIEAVINTLNTIEVKGVKNLDAMLGCIQTLEQVHAAMTKEDQGGDESG